MLAGCCLALLSLRHGLSSEAPMQFQACHLSPTSTKRLDLHRSFVRKDAFKSQIVRPVGLSVDKPRRQNNIVLPPPAESGRRDNRDEFRHKSLKRRCIEVSYDEETCISRAKRKRFDSFLEGGSNVHDQLVPSNVGAQSFPWFDCAVMELTGSRQSLPKEASGLSNTSSGSRGLNLGPSGNPVTHDIGNGSTPPSPRDSTRNVVPVQNDENNIMEHDCIELVDLLVACVEHLGSKNVPSFNHCLARLGEHASPKGSSSIHRIVAYYTEALALRVTRLWPEIFTISTLVELDRIDDESGTAWGLLNDVSPIPKFVQFTSNEILLRAFEGKDRVHIIDFDLKQGLQWPSLFQSLASRTRPPNNVRITGIGESKRELNETGDRLAGFAGALNLPFEFHPVADRLEDVRLWMLHIKEGETVAVNCAFQVHKMLYDITGGALNDFLGLIRSTGAEIVVTAEQEGAHNEPNLDARHANSLKYYSAIFDSLDSSLPLDSLVRIKIEEMFGRQIRNVIACEGGDRYERHETFCKWKELMVRGGFCCKGISEREVLQADILLKMFSDRNYRVEKEKDGAALTLSWSDQPLYTVSSWSPVDTIGSSSSYAQPR